MTMRPPIRVYLDACCINRPFDDQAQDRIRLEADAVLLIIGRVETGVWEWFGSEALDLEIGCMPDLERRARVRLLMQSITSNVEVGQQEGERARELIGLGLQTLDALHVACAERAAATVLLTTDDRLLRGATRLGEQVRIRVANPVVWLGEMMGL